MAAKKYLTLGSFLGIVSRFGTKAATQQSAGAANGGDIVALADNGFLDPTVLPPGVVPDVQLFPTSDTSIVAGTLINLYPVTSGNPATTVETARKADLSSPGKSVRGFAGGSPQGGMVAVVMDSICTFATGLVDGEVYADPTTPGGITQTRPSSNPSVSSPAVEQSVGYMITSTSFQFQRGDTIAL